MNESRIGRDIRNLLDQGLSVDAQTADRLRSIREDALERQRTRSVSAPAWAIIAYGPVAAMRSLSHSLQILVAILTLAAGIYVMNSWHQAQLAQEAVQIDAAVLTGELPIDAYLDPGFNSWLRHSVQ